jgi:hypothetical protein
MRRCFSQKPKGPIPSGRATFASPQVLLERMRESWLVRGLPALHVRMGLSTGSVLHGNIGSSTRMEWGLIGDEARSPARTHSYTPSPSLHLNPSVYAHLCHASRLSFKPLSRPTLLFPRPSPLISYPKPCPYSSLLSHSYFPFPPPSNPPSLPSFLSRSLAPPLPLSHIHLLPPFHTHLDPPHCSSLLLFTGYRSALPSSLRLSHAFQPPFLLSHPTAILSVHSPCQYFLQKKALNLACAT